LKGKEQPTTDRAFDSKLLSVLSHDIRQPLGMLKSLAILLQSGYQPTPDGLIKMIESIERAADISLDMCDNILPWIKWRLMNEAYQPSPLPLRELFNETIQQFTGVSETRNITIQNKIEASVVINADKQLLQLINKVLLDHALFTSHEQSAINITTELLQQEIVVSITVSHSSTPAETIDNLFHFQADQPYSSDKEKSMGIALMIGKTAAEKMHGRIWANRKEQGIIFCYTLPC